MPRIIRKNILDLPFSLHDEKVTTFEVTGNKLILQFQDGFLKTVEPFKRVGGWIEFGEIDWDFSFTYIFEYPDVLCGNEGSFIGRKMSLKDFITEFSCAKFEIIDETYSYNTSKFDGYLSTKNQVKECRLEIYHLGDMSYIIQD